ncbi:nuclear transport factor 2 family protein [Megalodesulfovibrio paquesii]
MTSISSAPVPLPPVIETYFRTANAHDAQAVADCFAPDGVVVDEQREFRGPEAIRQWKEASNVQYAPRMEPLAMKEEAENGRTLVTARVSGTFPGSPVNLQFAFTLEKGRIARLEIDF